MGSPALGRTPDNEFETDRLFRRPAQSFEVGSRGLSDGVLEGVAMKRAVFLAALVTMVSTGAMVVAQQTSAVPQPRADALPAPGPASPKQSRTIPKPEGSMQIVPNRLRCDGIM